MISRRVLLYGRSLLLSGVTADLEQCSGLEVAQVATWAEARQLLAERVPDVLIFELTHTAGSHVLPLLLKHPRLLMIGLDAECNQALLVSGQEARSLTLDKIKEIAQGRCNHETIET